MPRKYVLKNPRKVKSPAERFWPKVQKAGPDDCWIWWGALRKPRKTLPSNTVVKSAYGAFNLHGAKTSVHAHRAAWIITHGKIPPGKFVCHTCDNRRCVNPAHLWLGTAKDNMQDCSQKMRCNNQFGPQTRCRDWARGQDQ
jgi:hypothetical protein